MYPHVATTVLGCSQLSRVKSFEFWHFLPQYVAAFSNQHNQEQGSQIILKKGR